MNHRCRCIQVVKTNVKIVKGSMRKTHTSFNYFGQVYFIVCYLCDNKCIKFYSIVERKSRMNIKCIVALLCIFGVAHGCMGAGAFLAGENEVLQRVHAYAARGIKVGKLVYTLLRFDSVLHSADRIVFADALIQQTVEGFRKKLMKAAQLQKQNERIWKVVAGIIVSGACWSSGLEMGIAGMLAAPGADVALARTFLSIGLAAPVFAGLSFAWTAPHWRRAAKRVQMYQKFIKNADVLFGLLSSAEFKKKMGVVNWGMVRKKRRLAEFAGFGGSVGGSLLSMIAHSHANPVIQGLGGVSLMISRFALKPIIANAIRKKGGANNLEQEFERIIDAYEKNGSAPYGLTMQHSAQGDSLVCATSVPESARDKYLRLLAERMAER